MGTPFVPVENRFSVYGDFQPDFQASWFNSVSFLNNWELSFLWHYSQGQQNINLTRFLSDAGGTSSDWNEDKNGDGTPNGIDREGEGAREYIEDASYLKILELGLYYTVPSSFLSNYTKNAVKNIRLGLSGNNVLLFSPYSGYDPEVSEVGSSAIGTGVAVGPFPSSRQFIFHIGFDF